ncbi:hypothetical protein PR048_002472 [Dryococelus australis]|uniref:PiggyBac transposable element-derived protein domain-containing protein n=1 Tax=Dryococelus australis TaxID=614101 RepID=A0ABQ9ILC6_9NEOP|nr:hypothetical protein PR048_002472 [Dryococelus australis]
MAVKVKKSKIETQEMAAFIALLIAAGKIHGNQTAIPELWTSHPAFCNPFFTAAISRSRFQFLCVFLRFDSKITRCTQIEESGDKLQAIREVFNILVMACIQNYSQKENLTVDERLASFRGKFQFRVYMKSKQGRYGIKFGYVLTQQMSLVGVTTNNFFFFHPLAEALLCKKLMLVDTLHANKREIPQQFLLNPQRKETSSIFAFAKDIIIVSYVPKKRKAVVLLLTQYHDATIHEDEDRKLEIIQHFKETKGGVDLGNMMTSEYSCVRMTIRWPLRLFMEIIDIADLNAYNPRTGTKITLGREDHELMLMLAKPHIEERAQMPVGFQNNIVSAIEAMKQWVYL